MALSEADIGQAEKTMQARGPRAVEARYDRRRARVVVRLDNGLELAFPPDLAEGLDKGSPAELSQIEISPAGLGLHWPMLDADLYLPGLLSGVFGSPRWMAGLLGRLGGRASTEAKAAAARTNGQRGGRPRKAG
jgi:Protein of unknown function (DUF2442)